MTISVSGYFLTASTAKGSALPFLVSLVESDLKALDESDLESDSLPIDGTLSNKRSPRPHLQNLPPRLQTWTPPPRVRLAGLHHHLELENSRH